MSDGAAARGPRPAAPAPRERAAASGRVRRALRRAASLVYRRSEMVWLLRDLATLEPRYTRRRGGIEVAILSDANRHLFEQFRRAYPYRAGCRVLDDVDREGFTCFLALSHDEVVGVMLLGTRDYHYQEPRLLARIGPGEVCVYGIWILPQHRGGMVAAPLVETALLEFRRRGYRWATGLTDITNTPSLGITERFGFQERNRVRFHTVLSYQLRSGRDSSCER